MVFNELQNDKIPDEGVIWFVRGTGCWTTLGFTGGEKIVSLGENCMGKGTIQHETLHVLGLDKIIRIFLFFIAKSEKI